MGLIDLHMHTTASDGTDLPSEAVAKAASLGLEAIALTDHDTAAGVAEASAAGKELGVEVVPGIEVSSDYRDNNIHILGYFIDPEAPALWAVLEWIRTERIARNEYVVNLLADDGFDISVEELRSLYPEAVLGRPHMAELLMRKGYVSSVQEGFERYLGEGGKYYLPKRRISMARAVETILGSGGLAVLAHPLQYRYPREEVTEMIEYAKSLGAAAIECFYSEHSAEDERWLLGMAERYGMGVSGGSDYHGTRKTHISMGSGTNGNLAIPYEVLERLKKLHRSPARPAL